MFVEDGTNASSCTALRIVQGTERATTTAAGRATSECTPTPAHSQDDESARQADEQHRGEGPDQHREPEDASEHEHAVVRSADPRSSRG